jgi:hypothetical protein
MLCTAVALNLEGSPTSKEEASKNPLIAAKLGGMEIQHLLSTCMAAMPVDSDDVPFQLQRCLRDRKRRHGHQLKKNEPGTPTKIGLPGSVHPIADQVIRRFPVTNR